MRNISFALTTEQVRTRTKTVTRRLGWTMLQPGTLLQPVVKGMGLGKGGRVETIGGPIRVVAVRREALRCISVDSFYEGYGAAETIAEGFPEMTPTQFVEMFCRAHRGCTPGTFVTRIEFEYL